MVVGLALVAGSFWQWRERNEKLVAVERGRQHFEGLTELKGRMPGHSLALPALATRCANCHLTSAPDAADGAGAASQVASAPSTALGRAAASAAPRLGAQGLMLAQKRRGGPPSSYDAASLCRLLALGQDPVYVVISTNMPRYDVTARECEDLWAFLTSK